MFAATWKVNVCLKKFIHLWRCFDDEIENGVASESTNTNYSLVHISYVDGSRRKDMHVYERYFFMVKLCVGGEEHTRKNYDISNSKDIQISSRLNPSF